MNRPFWRSMVEDTWDAGSAGATGRRPRSRAGFSILEVLFISVVVLVVLLALVPLFTNALMSNVDGWSATEGVSFGRSELEERSALELDRTEMVLASGTALNSQEAWDQKTKEWVDPAAAPDQLIWTRDTRIRHFSISDLVGPADQERKFDNPLDAAIDPRFVHFREITTWVEHQKGLEEDSVEDPTVKVRRSRGLDVTLLRSY